MSSIPSQVQAQYASFRSSPNEFPSYKNLRFVRLDDSLLPRVLRDGGGGGSGESGGDNGRNDTNKNGEGRGDTRGCSNGNNSSNNGTRGDNNNGSNNATMRGAPLHHPCLLYHSIPELIRDAQQLDLVTKHKLIMEHRRLSSRSSSGNGGDRGGGGGDGCIVRLIGWRDDRGDGSGRDGGNDGSGGSKEGNGSSGGNNNNKDSSHGEIYFPPATVDILRIPSLSEAESNGKLLDFFASFDLLEEQCGRFESEVTSGQFTSAAGAGASGSVGGTSKREPDKKEILRYCKRWKRALHYALNVMSVDVGDMVFPLPQDLIGSDVGSECVEERVKSAGRSDGQRKTGTEGSCTNDTYSKSSTKSDVKSIVKRSEKRKALGDIANTAVKRAATAKSSATVSKPTSRSSSSVKSSSTSLVPNSTNNNVPPLVSPIDPYSPFRTAWDILLQSGWTWKPGSGLMTDYYYIKPGRRIKGGTVGVDYFCSRGEVEAYMKKWYGWIGEEGMEQSKDCTKAKVSLEVEEQSQCSDVSRFSNEEVPPLTSALDPHSDWRSAWDVLLESGWTWKSGSGLMTDYYYIKPGRKIKGGTAGVDYFCSREEVEGFMRRWYGWIGEEFKPKTKPDIKPPKVSLEFEDDSSQKSKKPKVAKIQIKDKGGGQTKKPKVSLDEDEGPKKKKVSKKTTESKSSASDSVSEVESSCFITEWKKLWPQLQNDGWTVIKAGKYNRLHDWYWVRPGCQPGGGAELGRDYFLSEEDVLDFVKGSGSNGKSATLFEGNDDIESVDNQSKSTDDNSSNQSMTEDDDESSCFVAEWKSLWPQLKEEGWTVIKAGKYNRLHDWYWVRPGCEPGPNSELGRDYFLSEEDAMEFVKSSGRFSHMSPADKHIEMSSIHSPYPSTTQDDESSCFVTEWKSLWPKLKEEGWTVIKAGKYNRLHDWYWVRPGCEPGPNSELGRDYFLSEGDAMEFIKESGWSSKLKDNAKLPVKEPTPPKQQPIKPPLKSSSCHPHTPLNCKTKPQDPSIPLPPSPESSPDSQDEYSWHNLWPRLKIAGWTCINAGKYNILHSYYYVRPGYHPGDVNCLLGKHYFECQEDVIQHVRKYEEGSTNDKMGRKSLDVMHGIFEKEAEAEVLHI